MKLAEALGILKSAASGTETYKVSLACGFTPLHLRSFLGAHLQLRLPAQRCEIAVGLYDDLLGSVASLSDGATARAVVLLEWADLDPRLGFRSLGGWGVKTLPAILESTRERLAQLQRSLSQLPSGFRVVLSLPTLPLPPAFHTACWQASEAELMLRKLVADFANDLATKLSVLVLNHAELDQRSPMSTRYDLRGDVNAGFPYSLTHAETLASGLAGLLQPAMPKKGIITDLDDTLWSGLVGEVGSQEVHWDLANHAQLHGLYQQMLRSLAEQGVLVAVASKNTASVALEALQREDCILRPENVYPLEIHWEPKSTSVKRILKTWNIGADSVVFVDDNQLELDEVSSTYPEIQTLRFPKGDHAAFLPFLHQLRDCFGKPHLSDEDTLRLASIRQAQQLSDDADGLSRDALLAGLDAEIVVEIDPPLTDTRVLELINKTNQFNLNGRRISEDEWAAKRSKSGAVVASISYRDKYGPLGKIAVASGQRADDGSNLHLESWVMSCRAFSRRIEYQTLVQLFELCKVPAIAFDFQATAKNEPTQAFLRQFSEISNGAKPVLTREQFEALRPQLHHKVFHKNG